MSKVKRKIKKQPPDLSIGLPPIIRALKLAVVSTCTCDVCKTIRTCVAQEAIKKNDPEVMKQLKSLGVV